MKSRSSIFAILTATALGLGSASYAETQGDEGASSGGDNATEQREGRRERRNQSTDADRRTARQERREAREESARRDDARQRRADRRRTNADDMDADRRDQRRQERREARREAARRDDARQRRADRRRANADDMDADRRAQRRQERRRYNRDTYQRRAGYRDDRGRRPFERTRAERRHQAWKERGFRDQSRPKHRGFENRVDRRVSRQHARIRDGWRNGDLTRKELKRLRKDQRKIARMDRRFGRDGHYTKRERRKLNKALDRASHRVYRAKHNRRTPGRARMGGHRW